MQCSVPDSRTCSSKQARVVSTSESLCSLGNANCNNNDFLSAFTVYVIAVLSFKRHK